MKPFSIFITIVLAIWCNILHAQPSDKPPHMIPGHCYAKCLMADLYETTPIEAYSYYGDDSTIIADYTIQKSIIIQEKKTRWVKQKTDKDCWSSDPNDCLVWCRVEEEEIVEEIEFYLTDLSVTGEFEIINYTEERLIEKRGYTEWQEIVCRNEITPDLIQDIRNVLGMPEDEPTNTLSTALRTELVQYQKKNGLPVGHLDLTTLQHMGITWF